MNDPEEFVKHVKSGKRPEPVDESVIQPSYAEIMKNAWETESTERPSAEVIYKKLSACLEDYYLAPPSDNDSNDDSFVTTSYESPPNNDSFDDAMNHHKRKQYEKALPIFQRLASIGHGNATYYIAYYYYRGYGGLEKNKSKALDNYRKSADLGCHDAEYYYAVFCLADASEYMERAAKHGYVKAGIKFVELQLSKISWLLVKNHDDSKLLEYLKKDESAIANYDTKIRNELKKQIEKLRKMIQTVH